MKLPINVIRPPDPPPLIAKDHEIDTDSLEVIFGVHEAC